MASPSRAPAFRWLPCNGWTVLSAGLLNGMQDAPPQFFGNVPDAASMGILDYAVQDLMREGAEMSACPLMPLLHRWIIRHVRINVSAGGSIFPGYWDVTDHPRLIGLGERCGHAPCSARCRGVASQGNPSRPRPKIFLRFCFQRIRLVGRNLPVCSSAGTRCGVGWGSRSCHGLCH